MRMGSRIFAMGVGAFVVCFCTTAAVAQRSVSPSDLERALSVADDLSLAFEHASSMVSASVVNVRTATRVAGGAGTRMQPFRDPLQGSPFREFFGDDFFERFAQPMPRNPQGFVRQGQGTGFVVSEHGHILTNHHVIRDATEIMVQLGNGRQYTAEVIGSDPSTDLAVIRIQAEGLRPVRFGDSDDLRVGSWVVAVGNPFGLDATITAGIVSAKGRTRVGIADYEDFIQTDAAINPGNSGGPLVNLRGEVVGVNTAIATRSGGNMGIGFAIPSNLALSILNSLKLDGVVTRGWLGVVIQDLDEALASSFGFEGTDGVLVSQVQEGSPAERGGLKAGDIIVRLNEEPIRRTDQLRLRVAGTEPGSTAQLLVHRDGERMSIGVEIGTLGGEAVAGGGRDAAQPALLERLGLQTRDLDPQLARMLEVDTERGAAVTSVEPLSAAARAGLRPRDVITHVHGTRIGGTDELRRALDGHDLSRGVRLTVRSGQAQRFVVLRE